MKLKKKYIKPKIKTKKIKVNFFLSKVRQLDQFSFFGNVYAQSGAGDAGNGGDAGDAGGTP